MCEKQENNKSGGKRESQQQTQQKWRRRGSRGDAPPEGLGQLCVGAHQSLVVRHHRAVELLQQVLYRLGHNRLWARVGRRQDADTHTQNRRGEGVSQGAKGLIGSQFPGTHPHQQRSKAERGSCTRADARLANLLLRYQPEPVHHRLHHLVAHVPVHAQATDGHHQPD